MYSTTKTFILKTLCTLTESISERYLHCEYGDEAPIITDSDRVNIVNAVYDFCFGNVPEESLANRFATVINDNHLVEAIEDQLEEFVENQGHIYIVTVSNYVTRTLAVRAKDKSQIEEEIYNMTDAKTRDFFHDGQMDIATIDNITEIKNYDGRYGLPLDLAYREEKAQ